jgi:hypothetical protein
VFVKHRVSVSVLFEQGALRGWLTRESGRVPAPCGDTECVVCSARGSADTREELRRSYMVFAARPTGMWFVRTVFAKLETAVIDVVFDRLVPHVGLEEARDSLFNQLSDGLWSSAIDCECSVDAGMCDGCQKVSAVAERRRFLRSYQFDGVHPKGKEHWFAGVTDALEIVGEQWLRRRGGCSRDRSLIPIGDFHLFTSEPVERIGAASS